VSLLQQGVVENHDQAWVNLRRRVGQGVTRRRGGGVS